MAVAKEYEGDVQAILSHIHDNGGELWTTPDKRLLKGAPFSAYESAMLLLELGMEPQEPLLKEVAELFFSVWKPDGRFKVYPSGGIYPCHTIHAAHLLCCLGYAKDERLQTTLQHLWDARYTDGGWRCNKFSFGRGPETEGSNPLPTLMALDIFRMNGTHEEEPELAAAVELLLQHWVTRKPAGPCQYGIGKLFMQVEYPMRGYNLFQYVYMLSFHSRARKDPRFLDALQALQDKLVEGQIVVERVVPKLAKLKFCRKGQPSKLATKRYAEILHNMEK